MKVIINEVPLSKNKYVNMHWSKRGKYKEGISWLIWEQKLNLVSNRTPVYKKATVTFDIYFKVKRRRDTQNYFGGGLISWLDALVDNSIIADDCYDCIGQPQVRFFIDKVNPRTEIIIERRD